MALERQSIERKDFPIGRRGYEPDAVDAHLRSLADEVEALKRSAGRSSETLASTASEQVRTIIEAAESSAAAIRREAEDEARALRARAAAEAESTREKATTQAREYLTGVSEATAAMTERVDAMESELGTLVESLRSGSVQVAAELQLLMSNLAELRSSVGAGDTTAPETRPEPGSEPPAGEAVIAEPEVAAVEEPAQIEDLAQIEEPAKVEAHAGHDAPVSAAPQELAPAPREDSGNGADDTEGARLIALNMALNGTPREETDRYLAENFTIADRGQLLDEVYASIEG